MPGRRDPRVGPGVQRDYGTMGKFVSVDLAANVIWVIGVEAEGVSSHHSHGPSDIVRSVTFPGPAIIVTQSGTDTSAAVSIGNVALRGSIRNRQGPAPCSLVLA